MTDNRTTELLREGLTERGVKWTSKPTHPETTWAHNGWCHNAKFEPWGDSTFKVTIYDLTLEQAVAATLGRPRATSNQESIVRSFLRKIIPNRDWDYLGEHEHAMIADLVDDMAATLGSKREKRLEKLVRIYGEIGNYFCERFACCDAEFANCKYCIGLPQGGQCELGWCNDESKALGIEQPDYGGGECEPVNLQELYDRIGELEELARDMWFWGYEGHMDSESQDWQMKHIDGVLDRMKELGIEVIDE